MSAADLLSQIHEAPHDLALRSIYADALQAAGDPRGEVIALQLAHADDRRVEALLAEHWRTWLGPIARCTDREDISFRDGFLVAVTIREPAEMTRLEWHRIHRAAEWSTVESLLVEREALARASSDKLAGLFSYAPLVALQTIDAPVEVLRLVRQLRSPVRSVSVSAEDDAFTLQPDILRGADLLFRRLGSHYPDPCDRATWQLAIDAGAASLTIASSYEIRWRLGSLVDAIATYGPRPAEIWYRFADCHVAIRADSLEFRLQPEDARFDALATDILRVFDRVLPDFARVDVVAATDSERLVFGGTSMQARAWLAERPLPPDEDDRSP